MDLCSGIIAYGWQPMVCWLRGGVIMFVNPETFPYYIQHKKRNLFRFLSHYHLNSLYFHCYLLSIFKISFCAFNLISALFVLIGPRLMMSSAFDWFNVSLVSFPV